MHENSNFDFKRGNNRIEICDEFKYLGLEFTKHRSFYKAMKHNADQALHHLNRKINN